MSALLNTDTHVTSSPDGRQLRVAADVELNGDPYTALVTPEDVRNYYAEHGYVVRRNLIPETLCDEAKAAFEEEVKSYRGYIYRQATANPEKHHFSDAGYMLNSILNIQDLRTSQFPRFKEKGLSILAHDNMQLVIKALLGEEGKLVQSMYFEGNPATWAHQDTYYLDSMEVGRMVAAWIAVEDIKPGAGRFYVYPNSHKIDVEKNGGDFNIAFQHARYKQLVLDIIKKYDLECRAPALRKGDVLFWSSKTIHGSLKTTQPQFSRSSFTAHFIPQSTKFLQWQSREKPLNLVTINSIQVHSPKNLDKFTNRVILFLESRLSSPFQIAKKLATRWVTRGSAKIGT